LRRRVFESAGVFDVNNDGIPDIVSGGFWYEGPHFTRRHRIGDVLRAGEYYDDFSTIPLDINGDGAMDFVTGGWWGNTLRWRENPGVKGGDWPEHIIAETGNVETTRAWDVDGDGALEIVPNTAGRPARRLQTDHRCAGTRTGQFAAHRIYSEGGQGHGLGFRRCQRRWARAILSWLMAGWKRRKDPYAGTWTLHREFNLGSASIPILVVDVNGDGLNDLIVGQAHGYGLDWLEQARDSDGNRVWIKHPIDPYNSQYHDLQWADIDGDGQNELITGKRFRAHNDHEPGWDDDLGI